MSTEKEKIVVEEKPSAEPPKQEPEKAPVESKPEEPKLTESETPKIGSRYEAIVGKDKITYVLSKDYLEFFHLKEIKVTKAVKEIKEVSFFKILYSDIASVHPLSKHPSKKGGEEIGLLVTEVKVVKKQKTHTTFYRIVLPKIDKSVEEKLCVILQQMVFLGVEKIEDIKEFKLIDNEKRKLLVVVNPKAGKKKGKAYWTKKAKPIFELGHFKFEEIYTESSGHAIELCKKLDFEKYNEICCVGGDGTFSECVNGLMKHEKVHYSEAIKTPISIVPSGTGDGLATECGGISPERGALIACRGKVTDLDVASVFQDGEREFSTIFICFGAVAEANTKFSRALGEIAFTLGGLHVISKKKYLNFNIKYVRDLDRPKETPFNPAKKPPKTFYNIWKKDFKKDVSKTDRDLPDCPFIRKHLMKELKWIAPQQFESIEKPKSRECEKCIKSEYSELLNESSFLMFLQFLPKMSKNFWASSWMGIANGQMDLMMLTKKVNRKELLEAFMAMKKDDPVKHMSGNFWRGYRVKACCIEPQDVINASIIDGEQRKYSPIIVEVHQGLCKVLHI